MTGDATCEAEQAAHALALLSEQAGSAEQPSSRPSSAEQQTSKMDRHGDEDALEYIRRKMALLQQESQMSTQQLQQQVAWLRQQMFSVVTKVRMEGADQDEDDEEELNGLERLLQQSISVLHFTEGKLKQMREGLQQQPVHPHEPPPPMPFLCGTPFPPPTQPPLAACPPTMSMPAPMPPLPFSAMPPPTLPPMLERMPPPLMQNGLAEQPPMQLGQQPVLPQRLSVPPSTRSDRRGGAHRTAAGPGGPRMRLLSEAFITRCGFWPPSGKRGKASTQDSQDSADGGSDDEDSSLDDLEDAWDSQAFEHKETAFNFFCAKALADIKASNPKTAMSSVTEKLSHLWREAKPEQKKPFEEMAAAHAQVRARTRTQHTRIIPGPSLPPILPSVSTSSMHAAASATQRPHALPVLNSDGAPAGREGASTDHNKGAHKKGASNIINDLRSSSRASIPQVAPPTQQPTSQQVSITAFQLFCSHRPPEMIRSRLPAAKTVQPEVLALEAQQSFQAQWNTMSTEEKEHWYSEAKNLLQRVHAPEAPRAKAGVAEDRPQFQQGGLYDKAEDKGMEDEEDGREDLEMDGDAWPGAQAQERERVQEATVMVRGGPSSSSKNPVQRIPITTSMLQKTYCFPRNKAAKYLGVCPNVLKRICRDYRIERWPFRKLQSLDHLIKNAQEQASLDPKGTKEIVNELQRMKTEIFANPNLELDDRIKKLQRVNYKNDYKLRQHKGTSNGRGRKRHKSSGKWITQPTSQEDTPERDQAEDEDEDGDQKDGDEDQKDEEELPDAGAEQEEEEDGGGDMQLDEEPQEQKGLSLSQVGLVGPGAAPQQPPVVMAGVAPGQAPTIHPIAAPLLPQSSPLQLQQQPAVLQGQGQRMPSVQLEQPQPDTPSEMHREGSQGLSWEEGRTSMTMQPSEGRLNASAPLAENEIVPRVRVSGHTFKSSLNNTFGGDFVDENGCIDGTPYEPEMAMRLSTGGEERMLRRSMLARVFHLPIQSAADCLNMSTSWLKKISRSFCIDRWPYRKLQSLDHLIWSVEEQAGADPDDAAEIIKELRQIKKEIYSNPDAQLDNKIKRLRQANYKLEYKLRHNLFPAPTPQPSSVPQGGGPSPALLSSGLPGVDPAALAAAQHHPIVPGLPGLLPGVQLPKSLAIGMDQQQQQQQAQPRDGSHSIQQEACKDAGALAGHVPCESAPAVSAAQQPFPPELPPSSPDAMAAAAAAAVADLVRPPPSQQQPVHANNPEQQQRQQQLPPQGQQEQQDQGERQEEEPKQ